MRLSTRLGTIEESEKIERALVGRERPQREPLVRLAVGQERRDRRELGVVLGVLDKGGHLEVLHPVGQRC